jgi:hypothetical protein
LWRELHRRDPVQLQFAFKNAAKKGSSEDSLEKASVEMMPLFSSENGIVTGIAKHSLR